MKENILKILERFAEKQILIVGDVMLDTFLYGTPTRINPEAPTILLSYQREEAHLGGAGNVASNIRSLGANATIFSFVGNDTYANTLKKLFKEAGVHYFFEEDKQTIYKERIVADQGGKIHQIVRVDRETIYPKTFSEELEKKLLEEAKKADIIIISDYAKGTITKKLMTLLKDYKEKTLVDPKQLLDLYTGSFLITPNETEAINLVTSMRGIDEEALISPKEHLDAGKTLVTQSIEPTINYQAAGTYLQERSNSNILITRGPKGMSLFSKENFFEIPTRAQEVYDVSGAGDTVIATLALALAASQKNLRLSAEIANYAAGIAVKKKGTYSVTYKELKEEIERRSE